MRYRGKVKTLDEAIAKEPKVGDGFLLTSEDQIYIWSGTEWELPKKNINLKMTNYELNQQVVAQLPNITDEKLQEGKELIENFTAKQGNEYYMLLCKEENYYTVFHYIDANGHYDSIADGIIELITEALGNIKSIESIDGGIEVWTTNSKKEAHASYLFPYDAGIVNITK